MKFSTQAFSIFFSATAMTTVNAAAGFYTYDEASGVGPSNWAKVDVADNQCGGAPGSGYGQSPVAVDDGDKCATDMSAYKFTPGTCTWEQLDYLIENNGVKAAPKADAGCTMGSMNIPHTPNAFNALQFHIHTSSEHTIGEKYFGAELHVVHQESTKESFAVFGTMITGGGDDHPAFENYLRGWEAAALAVDQACATSKATATADWTPVQKEVTCPAVGSSTLKAQEFTTTATPDIYSLPTNKDFGVFTYKGGLTTPPCTEIVNWNLLDTPMVISDTQLTRLLTLIMCYTDAETCLPATLASVDGSTSRPPQPLNGRTVVHRCRTCDGCEVIVDQAGTVPAANGDAAETKPAEGTAPTAANGGGGGSSAASHMGLVVMAMTSAAAVLMM